MNPKRVMPPPNFLIPPVSDREKLLRKIDRRDLAVKAIELFVLGFVSLAVLLSNLQDSQATKANERSIAEHRNQIEQVIQDSNKSAKILLCTTSIAPDVKTQAEVDKCYPKGSQAEYFKLLDIPPSEL